MIEGEPFFNGQSKHEFENHVKNRPRKAGHAVPELAELIFFCLREFPHERPSFTILREKLESIHIRLTGKSLPPPVDNHQLSAEELNARGAGFDELGEYDNALECYNEAIEKDPSDFRFYLNRANTFLSKDNFKEAQENYQQALIIAPRAVEVYLGMGALKAGMKRFEEALECFKKGLEIDKSEPLIFVSLGNLYGQMGYCDEAEFHFRKALALNSGQAEAYFGLGNVQFLRGNSEEALKEYYTALRYNPLYDKALQAIDYIKYPEL
jgi:tetratricopeptide (TPR) repeat protein